VTFETPEGSNYQLGDEGQTNWGEIHIACGSTEEFGPLSEIALYMGIIGETETLLFRQQFSEDQHVMIFEKRIPLQVVSPLYIRGRVTTRGNAEQGMALTNPIWLRPSP
jgi:hypothetical protein